jgi:hypothetical protein
MSDRPNPLASVMQQAAAAKDRGSAPSAPAAEPAVPPVERVVEPAAPDGRRRSSRPRFEDVYRRATFFIHPDQLKAIEATAYRLGLGKSEFVRAAIDEKLRRDM